MKRLLFVLSIIFASVFTFTPAQAADTLVFNNTTSCAGWGPGTNTWAYRMYAASASTITAMEVPFSTATGYNATTLAIYSSSGGAPGTLLGTFNFNSYTSNVARFTGSATVSIGDFYWVYHSSVSSDPCSAGTTSNSTGSGWTMSQYRYSGVNGAGPFTYDSGGGSAAMLQLKIYTGVVDTTPPTFLTGTSYSAAEIQTSVGSIKASESSTITISGGVDQAKFSIAQSDSVTANLSFITAPNFEVPTDVGADNTYQVVIRAADMSGNFGYETVTATVTDVDENARVTSYVISGLQSKGLQETITATVNFASKVTFLANGKKIPGCISKSTVGSGPITVTCMWKPSSSGNVAISFKVVPTASNNFATTSAPFYLQIGRRNNLR